MIVGRAKMITVTSVKGGSGKSTTVLNLAGIYSLQKKKVLIIDLDLYSSAICAMLNLTSHDDLFRLVDDLNNNRYEHFEDYIIKYNYIQSKIEEKGKALLYILKFRIVNEVTALIEDLLKMNLDEDIEYSVVINDKIVVNVKGSYSSIFNNVFKKNKYKYNYTYVGYIENGNQIIEKEG